MNQPLITNIQKYSIHDGTGTRTTVFFQGCPLRCAWCHNPETQRKGEQLLFYKERCTGCGNCESRCKNMAVRVDTDSHVAVTDLAKCIACGDCVEGCFNNAREICGKQYEVEDLVKELKKDQIFYETSGGGVTLSGGEVMSQDMDYLVALLKELKKAGISVFIDTCGAVEFERFNQVLPYVDTFLYDLKLLNEILHRKYTGVGVEEILDNLKNLSDAGASIWIRLPIIGGVNDTKEHVEAVGRFLTEEQINYSRITLLPYHNTGSSKYERLGLGYEGEDFYVPAKETMEQFADILRGLGCKNIETR